eukprot:SAG31_NODE_21425_length_550_cov_0.689579_2_plen_110_part_01
MQHRAHQGAAESTGGDGSETETVPASQLLFLPRVSTQFEVLKFGPAVAKACPQLSRHSWARTKLTHVDGTKLTSMQHALGLVKTAGETVELRFEQILPGIRCPHGHHMLR